MQIFAVAALLAQAALTLPGTQTIAHSPVDRLTRGKPALIRAVVHGTSDMFAPLVYARPAGKSRYTGFPMLERGKDVWVAHLPQSVLSGPSFSYFIEVRLRTGERALSGSEGKPYLVQVDDASIQPAKLAVTCDADCAVTIDGKEIGRAPLTFETLPGRHTISVLADDGRGAEGSVEAVAGTVRKVAMALPRTDAPARVSVGSEPRSARVYIDGTRVGETPYVGDAVPGQHKLTIEREGFLRQEREVTFAEHRDVEFNFTLVPLPRDPALSIESVPPGATVIVDGLPRGTAPWIGPLAAGHHEAVLKLQGRREVSSDFIMPEGRDLSLRLELPPPARNESPRLLISSKPEGASIAIDGAEVGSTPWAGEVKPGPHKVAIKLEGYTPDERSLVAHANREAEVSFALQHLPGPAQLSVESEPTGAELSIDGNVVGTTPLDAPIPLEAGEHQIEARRKGYLGVAQRVVVEPGQSASLRLSLAAAPKDPAPPTIAVATEPAGARLYVDDKLAGETPFRIKSTPGQHEIRVVLEGYVSRHAKIKLPEDSGFELRVAVSLKRTREAEQLEKATPLSLARAQLKRAQACYKQGDWACSLAGYQAAYEFKAVPDLLFNIAQARRKLGQLKEAATTYRSYIKDKPDGALVGEAERQARQCEAALASGEKKVDDQDTTPPVLHHVAVATAMQGKDLRIAAVITDDKSGAYAPQVCFRNLFSADFECLQLQPAAARDEFEAVVPARAVREGFAYFLEVYDNAGNGPARAGSPAAPIAVSLQDEQTVQANALAATAHTADRAALLRPAGVLVVAAAPEAPHLWDLTVRAFASSSVERYTDGIIGGGGSLTLDRVLPRHQLLEAQLDVRLARQPYRTRTPVPGAPAEALRFGEQRYSGALAYGVDLASLVFHTTRFSLVPMALAEYQHFDSEAFPSDLLGLGGQLLVRVALPGSLALTGAGAYGWNVLRNGTQNAVGDPRADLALRAGLEVALPGRHALELAYAGDLVTLKNDYRLSNGFSIGLSSTF